MQHCSRIKYFLRTMKQFVLVLFSITRMEPAYNGPFHPERLVFAYSLFDLLLGYLEMLLNWLKSIKMFLNALGLVWKNNKAEIKQDEMSFPLLIFPLLCSF